jgi:hypothetical protein
MRFVVIDAATQPMSARAAAVPLVANRRDQDRLAKWVVVLSLLLLVFGYLPTLRHDYVAPDQWRAFRYGHAPGTPLFRLDACARSVAPYYSRTGRPLLWLSECVEHAGVAKISDFAYLRPIALAIVLVASAYLGTVVAPFVGSLAMGVVAACAFAMAPAYAVMYLQGLTGSAVVICLILAAASFRLVREWFGDGVAAGGGQWRKLVAPLALFLVGCLIYPSWMFLVVGLSLLAASADIRVSRAVAFKRLFATLAFFAFASFLYYAFERLIEVLLEESTRYVPDMGAYSMAMLSTPAAILARVRELLTWFWHMPPLNFDAPPGLLPGALVLFSGYVGWLDYKRSAGRPMASIAVALATLVVGGVVLLASISPWLFSSMDYMATRFVAPWYLFFCVIWALAVRCAVDALPTAVRRFAGAFALLVFLLPVALRQHQLSRLETEVSGLEIQTMRQALGRWLDSKGYEHQRYVLVVRPVALRPILAERMLGDGTSAGENAQLSSAQNPVVVPWMIVALLRERHDHPVGRAVGMSVCVSDQSCVAESLRHPDTVATGVADSVHVIRSSVPPYVINLSLLTSKPVFPVIEAPD